MKCKLIRSALHRVPSRLDRTMGKEAQLLEAAAAGNNIRVEQLLKGRSRLKRLLSKERLLDSIGLLSLEPIGETFTDPDNPDGPTASPLLIQTKTESAHVDVDCRDENGSTPLILAALNGHKDVVYTLLQYSANIHRKDTQGNTALHFAAWRNWSEIVELLLVNGAKADCMNEEGNTPLHYSCQHCVPGKTFTINKLLQNNCSVLICNKAGDSPFDLAVRFNKKEAVSLLVDAEPDTLKQTKSIIEAAKNGRKDVVEILLEAGMDPNCFDGATGSCPLHEAVRYFRNDVAKVLLEFGARPDQLSANAESPRDIAMQHPQAKKDDFLKLFSEYQGKTARIPRSIMERMQESSMEEQSDPVFITYPLLRNKQEWTKADGEHCSAWTQKHPNTCLLDNDPTSYWKIPASGAYNWVAFDLGSEYTLTGVRIAGWDDKQMIHTFMVETAKQLSGPWKQIQKFKAECVGSEDMNDPAESQDYKGFYAVSRYWRLMIADNYGDPTTCLAEVQFFGVENDVIDWFERLELKQYLKTFIQRGFNQLSDLALLKDTDLQDTVVSEDEKRRMFHAVRILREKYFPPKNLSWAIQPITKATCDKMLPEIAVHSESYTVGDVELIIHGGAQIWGTTVTSLVTRDNGYHSRASFRGLSLSPAGSYVFEVRSVVDHSVFLRSNPITVNPPPMRNSEIGRVFQDLEAMLQFDI